MRKTQSPSLWQLYGLYVLVLVLWTLYRVFMSSNIWFDEIFAKGLIFSLPILVFPLFKSKTLGICINDLPSSVGIGLILGAALTGASLLGQLVKTGTILIRPNLIAGHVGAYLILAIITALFEQLLFAGYFFSAFYDKYKDELTASLISGLLFGIIHIPAILVRGPVNAANIVTSLVSLTLLGVATCLLKSKTKSLIAPIMAHVLWGTILFIFQ